MNEVHREKLKLFVEICGNTEVRENYIYIVPLRAAEFFGGPDLNNSIKKGIESAGGVDITHTEAEAILRKYRHWTKNLYCRCQLSGRYGGACIRPLPQDRQ